MLDKIVKFFERNKFINNRSPLVIESKVEGFIYGEITDHLDFDTEEGCTFGDGFVQAPDGTRAGIIWELSDEPYLSICIEPEKNRWGVYNAGFVKPIKTVEDIVYNFKTIFPLIKKAYNNGKLEKKQEVLLNEEIDEQDFVEIINSFYKQDCYIYAIIPEYEVQLLNHLSNDFIILNKFPLPRVFPKEIGYLGYVKDNQKQYIYEFYLRSTTIDYLIFSETDLSEQLSKLTKKNLDIYEMFQLNKVSHITIGPDGQWLNIVQY